MIKYNIKIYIKIYNIKLIISDFSDFFLIIFRKYLKRHIKIYF